MKLVALMPARNEDWIIGLSLRIALMWCDHAVVLDHASTDGTREIIEQIRKETGRLTIIEAAEGGWAEMSHRQMLLEAGRREGATHFAIVDADEVLTANHLRSMRAEMSQLPAGGIAQIPMRNTYGAHDQYRRDGSIWGNALTSLAFADEPNLYWASPDGYQHHHREPFNGKVRYRTYPHAYDGGVMHLQFASRRRLLAKHAWYQMHERITYPGKAVGEIARLYSLAPDWNGANIEPTPAHWWDGYGHLMGFLDVDREPWQEAECRRLLTEHGAETFAGLNLFGVV